MVGSHIDITSLREAQSALRARDAELLAAQKIQERLLPTVMPQVPGYDIAGASHPAEFAGGDCFDFLTFADGTLGVVIGDVSGHGFSSALLMASTHAHLRSTSAAHSRIEDVLARVNSFISGEVEAGRFITLFLCRIDVGPGEFSYASAGHCTGYVLTASAGVKAALSSTTIPLGIDRDTVFSTARSIKLDVGDIVLLCTDGVLEAMSADEELFGEDRALGLVREQSDLTASEIIARLYDAVRVFAGSDTLVDDFTVVIVKKLH
jgi:serine phosphatase RsbU (regulator of sigma subunit)